MKYYIAYKYSNNKNKEELKTKLENISKLINSWGDETFILGRDIKKWKHVHLGSFKLIPVIIKNMSACDRLLAYIDSPSLSKGLFFEGIISTLLGKKAVMYLENGVSSKFDKLFYHNIIHINDISELSREDFT